MIGNQINKGLMLKEILRGDYYVAQQRCTLAQYLFRYTPEKNSDPLDKLFKNKGGNTYNQEFSSCCLNVFGVDQAVRGVLQRHGC